MKHRMPPVMMVECPVCKMEGLDFARLIEEPCSSCEGHGILDEVPCPACLERGTQGCDYCMHEGVIYDVECGVCQGQGTREYHPRCEECRGTGWVPHPWYDDVHP